MAVADGPRRTLVRAPAGDFVGEPQERAGRSVRLLHAVEVQQGYGYTLEDLLTGNVRPGAVGSSVIPNLTIHEVGLDAELPERGAAAWESLFQQVNRKKEG